MNNNLPEINMVQGRDEIEINLKDIFSKLLDKWLWFITSIFLFLLVAFLYGKYTAPNYQIKAKLIVNDDQKGGGIAKQAGALMDLGGLIGSKNSVDNEVEILKTRFLMEQVAREMQLNIVYSKKTDFVSRELYQVPFKINILKGVDTIKTTKLNVVKVSTDKFLISTKNFRKEVTWRVPFDVIGIGTLQIEPNQIEQMDKGEYYVTISSIDSRVASLMDQLFVGASSKQVSIIDLRLAYPLPNKGEDILNTLIKKYTQSNLNDKNAVADSTYRFIKERLNVIASELGDVENKVETFKQQNQLADMSEQGKLLVQNSGELSAELAKAETQVSIINELEKYLKDSGNNKKAFPSSLVQELYIFLMQKAEETNISKTANISIAKIIDPPKSDIGPISPKKSLFYVIGFVVGLIVPICLIFGQELLNTSIKTKEEIAALTNVPVIGEISHNSSDDYLIVANHSRSAISEQLRTNLSFYLKTENEKIVLLTSSMSGEGKSFTAINLGNILALAGKKVLLMELDLRKPGLSAKLGVRNDMGFSNFTISPEVKMADIVNPLSINKNMFIVSSGPLPPNPAETLMNEHVPKLIEQLKKEFDYIIMDAPPVGIIADAQLLSRYADVTLYLVRQRITQKDQLKIVEDLYQTGKMRNVGIVVNDIISKYYGYGYGYGNYGETSKENWYKRIFKR